MTIHVSPDYETMSHRAGRIVASQLLRKPHSVLGLPAGRTPIGMYRQLTAYYDTGLIDFAESRAFGLDEYIGINADHPASFRRFLHDQLLDTVNIPDQRIHTLAGDAQDLTQACRAFEEALQAHPIDLMILGIGPNGHIAFNEPGSAWGSRTRPITLAEETVDGLRETFDVSELPTQGVTMGIRSIMHATRILLLASGATKAPILHDALTSPITQGVPASILQLHPNVQVLADEVAAGRLKESVDDVDAP